LRCILRRKHEWWGHVATSFLKVILCRRPSFVVRFWSLPRGLFRREFFPSFNVSSLGEKVSLCDAKPWQSGGPMENKDMFPQVICCCWVRPPSKFYTICSNVQRISKCDLSLMKCMLYNIIISSQQTESSNAEQRTYSEEERWGRLAAWYSRFLIFFTTLVWYLRSEYNYIRKSSQLKPCTWDDQLICVCYNQIVNITLF
jgi:hypothetical protein